MLSTAMTAFEEQVDAIRCIFSSALLIFETLGWTQPGWQQRVNQFPETPYQDVDNSAPADEVPQELLVRAFSLRNC